MLQFHTSPPLVIFDFDGTLGDTRQNIVRTLQATMQRLGLDMCDDATCASTIGLTLFDSFRAMYPAMSVDEAHHCVATYRDIYFEDVAANIPALFPNVESTIETLHSSGAVLAVASSRSSPSLHLFLQESGLADYFSCVIGSDNVTHHKPHPEPVEIILRRLNFSPSRALVVGDMPVDILMAHNAGVRACGVSYGNATREELHRAGADHIIDNIAELLDYVVAW